MHNRCEGDSNMKKICFVINKLTDGGAERVTSVVANCLYKRKKYEIVVVTFEKYDDEKEYYLEKGIKRVNIPLSNSNGTLGMAKNFINVRKRLLLLNCDCYIGIDIFANLLVSFVGMTSKCKTIISERNAPKQVDLRAINKMLRKVLYPFCNKIVFQTQGALEDSDFFLQKKGVIIPNPIKENLPTREAIESVVCAAGRLVAQKNYKMLLDAFEQVVKKHPEYKLSIYGQGVMEEELSKLIIKKGLEKNVTLEGYFEDVHNKMKNNEIFVLSSDYEGLPNSLMEAMAMGFPVVSTDCPPGGPRSLIENGRNGYLVPVNDSEKMAEKINYLIENKSFREKIGKEAEQIRKTYSAEIITRQWERVIEGI